MNRTNSFTLASGLLTILIVSYGASRADQTAPPTGPVLTVPAGFTIGRVAGPPLVSRPIVADFDEEGRLYVADSSGSNDKTDKQVIDRPHRIVRLEDTDGDGRFDKSVVFADKMMLPEGTMWLAGSLYVAAPPSIWKLTDTDGDGVADQREEWWQGKTLTGCANDLHGPYLGPDGWIYWTKGAFAEQTYERPGKPPFVTKASHLLRRRPGDPAVDVVMTGGMDNPVDVAFNSSGESFLTSTFVEQPQLGRRDGFFHVIYGGLYGKVNAVIDGHKRTGDLMPILCQLGPAVPAGLTNYSSRAFGDGFRDNFFAAMFNLRKVSRYALEPSGGTFTVQDSDFVVSEDRDFHPTDVIEDADGSLLVVDTGAWYKLCCPTSQLAKPDILGGIYRVRRTGAPAIRDPRGRSLAWNTMSGGDLTALLADQRPAVQSRAVRALGTHGPAAVTAVVSVLKQSTSIDARRNAVWALTRIDAAAAREAVRIALNDRDDSVRHAAIHSSGLWRDAGALPQLRENLKTGTPSIQRVAAESLGRIGGARAIPDLITLAGSPLDRVLEHSVTYALIEINNPAATETGLQSNTPRARRATLIALDQMDSGHLQPDQITSLLDSSDAVLKDTAWWIAGHHPEWGSALAGYFAARLAQPGISATARTDLEQKLTLFGDTSAVQQLLASNLERARSKDDQLSALRTMGTIARTRVKTLPFAWMDPLLRTLSAGDAELASAAVSVVRTVPAAKDAAPGFQASLLRVGHDASRPIEVRLGALAALPNGLTSVDPQIFTLLRAGIEPSQPMPIQSTAAAIIEKAVFNRSQLATLAASLESAGPLELPRLLRPFANASDEATGLAMMTALNKSAVRGSVRPDVLRPLIAKYPESVQKAGEALLASVTQDAANQLRRLEQLLPTIQGGDIVRGQAVFNSPKVACYSCHAIGYMGGRIGPDLTRIGQVRSERDLLEAIAYPSASFARGFEPVVVKTRSGQVHTGVLRNNDLPDEIVLATERDELRIPRRDIVEMQPGTVSLMPPGLIDQLTRQELADLVAFLKQRGQELRILFMRFAMCNELYENWSFADTCQFLKKSGYEGVEVAPFTLAPRITDVTRERRSELRKQAADAGIDIIGLHWLLAGTQDLYLTSPDAAVRSATAEYIVRLAEASRDLGGDLMVFGSPKQRSLLPGVSREQAFDWAAALFRQVMPQVADYGITICMEPLSTAETDFINTCAEASELIEAVGHANFALHLDVKAMYSESTPVTELIRTYGPIAHHFHANDANRRGPGFGDVDFVPIFDALRKSGYNRWVSVEVFDYKPDPETITVKSIEYMRQSMGA